MTVGDRFPSLRRVRSAVHATYGALLYSDEMPNYMQVPAQESPSLHGGLNFEYSGGERASLHRSGAAPISPNVSPYAYQPLPAVHSRETSDVPSDLSGITLCVEEQQSVRISQKSAHGPLRSRSAPLSQRGPGSPKIVSKHTIHSWLWEAVLCIVAVASLSAIVTTLSSYQDRPLPRLPFGISVNALISIYSVVLKGALITILSTIGQLKWTWFRTGHRLHDLQIYDEASRGLFGSFKLLWRIHIRQVLASVGAILTILLIFVDPFTQQLVHYTGCSTTMSSQVATLPRTNEYRKPPSHNSQGQVGFTDMMASINAGLFSTGTKIAMSCATGNCTFADEYATVSYCSHCEDISYMIDITLQCSNVTFDDYPASPANLPPECITEAKYNITSAIEGGLSMNSTVGESGFNLAMMRIVDNIDIKSAVPSGIHILVGKSGFAVQGTSPDTGLKLEGCDRTSTNNTWRCRGYGAAMCELYPCVKTFNATIIGGVLYEEKTSEITWGRSWGFDYANFSQGLVDMECTNSAERQALTHEGYNINSTERWLLYNVTSDLDQEVSDSPNLARNLPHSLLTHNCLYLIDDDFVNTVHENYLMWYFQGMGNDNEAVISGENLNQGDFTSPLRLIDGPQVLQTFYNYGNVDFERVDGLFSNISNSVTNFIRQNGAKEYSAPAVGQVHHYAICLEVQWQWLTFLVAVVVGCIVFLAALIVTTRVSKAPVWKNSVLATLFHGPFLHENECVSKEGNLPRTTNGMDATAKELMVRLDRTSGRLRVSETQVRSSSNG